MNDTEYKYFSEIASTLSFSKAAKNLYVSQPALSNCIAKLEAEFNVKLLNRTKNSVSLTPAGETLLNEYPKVMFANYQLNQKIFASSEKTGSIFIAIQNGLILNSELRQNFMEFEAIHPEISINYVNLTSSNIQSTLQNDDVDIAITFDTREQNEKHLQKYILDGIESYVIVGNENPVLNLETNDEIKQFLNNSTLLTIDNIVMPNMTSYLIKTCHQNGIFPKRIKYFKNTSTLCNNLLMNKGFSIIYKDALINSKMLEYLPLRNNKLCNLCAYVNLKNTSKALKLLIDFLNEKYN